MVRHPASREVPMMGELIVGQRIAMAKELKAMTTMRKDQIVVTMADFDEEMIRKLEV